MFYKKRKTKKIIEQIAAENHVLPAEVRADIQEAINAGRNNPDPEVQENFTRLFGSRTPTPEEFIQVLTKELKKESGKESTNNI